MILNELANAVEDSPNQTSLSVYRSNVPRKTKRENTERMRESRDNKRRDALVIAWDGEGMNLRGREMPQCYVLFGCSAEPNSPLMVNNPWETLGYKECFSYICEVGSRYPGAIHVGYSFSYDQNMLIQTMPLGMKERLKKGQWVRWDHEGYSYSLRITWRKRTHIIRTRKGDKDRVSVRIDDLFPSFHSSFISAYERYFPAEKRDKIHWDAVVEGKALRNDRDWTDMGSVRYYWTCEIVCLGQLGTLYRDLLFQGGFALSDFYGPGPIASFLRRRNCLMAHEWGAKQTNLPKDVHRAVKHSFYGGRFEQFLIGRIRGPIYSIDINSAYPYALCHIPSLAEGGFWQWREHDKIDPWKRFGFYHIIYRDEAHIGKIRNQPQRTIDASPLPYRNRQGIISYPPIVDGWYASPETAAVLDLYPERVTVLGGWEWIPGNDLFPWRSLMETMFAQRKALKEAGQPLEMVYKLGINSLYGKYAQRVGWNQEKKTPPPSHALAIAAYVTSMCRAMIMRVIAQIPISQLIAVETDGIYTTVNPAHLDLPTGTGKELGQWEAEKYDEVLYIQNGVYFLKKQGEWKKAKSRGFSSTLVSPESIIEYLQSLEPHKAWPKYDVEMPVSTFVGIGSAISWAQNGKGFINPVKAQNLHCQWIQQTRELIPGGKGKRVHVPAYCPGCQARSNPYERPHFLVSNHGALAPLKFAFTGEDAPEWDCKSFPHKLPWEEGTDYDWRLQQEIEDERIEYERDAVPSILP